MYNYNYAVHLYQRGQNFEFEKVLNKNTCFDKSFVLMSRTAKLNVYYVQHTKDKATCNNLYLQLLQHLLNLSLE